MGFFFLRSLACLLTGIPSHKCEGWTKRLNKKKTSQHIPYNFESHLITSKLTNFKDQTFWIETKTVYKMKIFFSLKNIHVPLNIQMNEAPVKEYLLTLSAHSHVLVCKEEKKKKHMSKSLTEFNINAARYCVWLGTDMQRVKRWRSSRGKNSA